MTLHSQLQSWTEGQGLSGILNWWTSQAGYGPQPEIDARVYQSDLTIENGKLARQLFSADLYGNRTDEFDYDYGTTGLPGPLLRQTHTDYVTGDDTIPASPADGTSANYLYVASLPSHEKVYDGTPALKSETDHSYDEVSPTAAAGIVNNIDPGAVRGNATTVSRWRDTDGGHRCVVIVNPPGLHSLIVEADRRCSRCLAAGY